MSTEVGWLQKRAFQTSKAKGFHDNDDRVTAGDRLMLIAGELAEAQEELRKGKDHAEVYFSYTHETNGQKISGLTEEQYLVLAGTYPDSKRGKPEGFGIELADAFIRILDTAATYGIDLASLVTLKMAYNEGREWRHGKSF